MKKIYFIGIAGSAMGTAAVELKNCGHDVSGSDSGVYPPISDLLKENNINIFNKFDPNNLKVGPDIVVVGNAIGRGNPEVEECMNNGIPLISLPELVREYFIRDKNSIVLTGTHGKSTTTSLAAWIWKYSGLDPGYLIGGVSKDLPKSCNLSGKGEFIIEGDEYDTAFFDKRSKFLHYSPHTVVINNIELDHVDIFRDEEDMLRTFRHLLNIIPGTGRIIANIDDENISRLLNEHPVIINKLVNCITYGTSKDADYCINNIHYQNGSINYSLILKDGNEFEVETSLTGKYQAYNSAASIITAINYGIESEVILEAVKEYKGMVRRMDTRGVVNNIQVIDDFAHHPTAVKETLSGLRNRFPDRRLIAVLEPRSNSMRRNIFQDRLVDSFKDVDLVIIAKVNAPEKVSKGERLDPKIIIQSLRKKGQDSLYLENVDDIVGYLTEYSHSDDVIIGMSNGGFDGFYEKLLAELKNRYKES